MDPRFYELSKAKDRRELSASEKAELMQFYNQLLTEAEGHARGSRRAKASTTNQTGAASMTFHQYVLRNRRK